MKVLKNLLLLITVIIFAVVFVSWNRFENPTKELNTFRSLYGDEFKFSPENEEVPPTAEDVLVQKIPGDNNHLLMMAFYSKENYSGELINFENANHLVFRDDGKGF